MKNYNSLSIIAGVISPSCRTSSAPTYLQSSSIPEISPPLTTRLPSSTRAQSSVTAQSSTGDSSSPTPSPPSQTSILGPLTGGVAGALLTVIIAVVILIGILVCCKRRVKTATANEAHYYSTVELSTAVTAAPNEPFYDYVSKEAADYTYPAIQTSANTAYGIY